MGSLLAFYCFLINRVADEICARRLTVQQLYIIAYLNQSQDRLALKVRIDELIVVKL